jgi:hypothetical protein
LTGFVAAEEYDAAGVLGVPLEHLLLHYYCAGWRVIRIS